MRLAKRNDEKLVISILTEAFETNPSVLSVVKPGKGQRERVRQLAKYAFRTAFRRNGVYLSSDLKGVAVCYQYNFKDNSLLDYWNQLMLVVNCIGFARIFKVMKRDAIVKAKRPKDGAYLYFWFFGVRESGRGKGSALELKNFIIERARALQLPVYLETSVEKNRLVYERYGFMTYKVHHFKNGPLWFMRKVVV